MATILAGHTSILRAFSVERARRPSLIAVCARVASVALLFSLPASSQSSPAAPHPLAFEANRGQADAQVQFVARGAGYTAFLTSTETVLRLGAHATVHLKPVGANTVTQILRESELPGVVNYFRHGPSTAISAATYRGVRYVDI